MSGSLGEGLHYLAEGVRLTKEDLGAVNESLARFDDAVSALAHVDTALGEAAGAQARALTEADVMMGRSAAVKELLTSALGQLGLIEVDMRSHVALGTQTKREVDNTLADTANAADIFDGGTSGTASGPMRMAADSAYQAVGMFDAAVGADAPTPVAMSHYDGLKQVADHDIGTLAKESSLLHEEVVSLVGGVEETRIGGRLISQKAADILSKVGALMGEVEELEALASKQHEDTTTLVAKINVTQASASQTAGRIQATAQHVQDNVIPLGLEAIQQADEVIDRWR